MTAVTADIEELEELLDGDPICAIPHDEMPEDHVLWGIPCGILATAILVRRCTTPSQALICTPAADRFEETGYCRNCGHRCFAVHSI